MPETLSVQKVAYIHAVHLERMVSVSLVRNELKKVIFSTFLPKKAKYKIFDVNFGPNVAYKTLVQCTKPWTLYSVLVLRYRG